MARSIRKLESTKDLVFDDRNPNRGTDRGREMLAASVATYGLGRSIVVDRLGRIISGNKVTAAALEEERPLRVIRTRGNEIIAVQRVDLDLAEDARAQALAVADNRASELNLDWDLDVLRALTDGGVDLSVSFTEAEFDALLAAPTAGLTDEDHSVEPRATTIQPGALFQLGRHRLLCGDSTVAANVDRVLDGVTPVLMVTDPPYGVSYDPAWRQRANPTQRTAVGRVTNDDRSDWSAAWRLFPGDVAYVWHAALKAGGVAADLESAGFTIRSQVIWRKQHFALGRGDFHWAHEPAWYAVRRGATSHWSGDRTQSTVWEVPNGNPMGGSRTEENAVTGHSTQKPVALYEICLRNHTTPADVLYDPFAGSGTALIAAERLDRACVAIEIEPRYVQAAIDRWEAYTGATAQQLDEPVRGGGH